MRVFEEKLNELRNELLDLWSLVISQMTKAQEAFLNGDKELAHEIVFFEKKVDAFELTIDKECENYLALNNPVAIDLRFIISLLKINSSLERMGDFAKGIARRVLNYPAEKPNAELIRNLQIDLMFKSALCMLHKTKEAFEKEDSKMASCVFAKDDLLDEIHNSADKIAIQEIQKNVATVGEILCMLAVIRKLERVGDHCTNISEELIFYLEAQVLKHQERKK